MFFHDFDKDIAVREVLMGVRCGPNDLLEFRALAEWIDPTIEVRATKLSNGAFEVVLA